MKKQIILISDVVSVLPNVITVSIQQFLVNTYKNAYVLIDRTFLTTKECLRIKAHCQDIGLNPLIDGCYMDVSYIFVPDWQAENEEDCYNNAVIEAIRHLEEAEISLKLYELGDVKMVSKTVEKLLRLANCSASPFGEKRNAINAAYNIVFG